MRGMKLRASSSMEASALCWEVRSEVVERERILRGWTRAQLTQAADIDPKTLRDLLTGRRRPTLGTMNTLSRALGMPLSEVITVVERRPRPGRPRAGRSAPTAQALLPLQ